MSKTHQEKAIENLVGKAVTLLSPQAQPFFLLAILSLLPLILPEAAGAQPTPPVGPSPPVTWVAPVSVPGGAGNGIIDEFRNLLTRLADTVGLRARQLLLFLFTVDIVLTIGKATMAGSSFADLLSRFIYRLLFVAFVLFITRYASDIVDMVTNAAITLANDASEGGEAIDPSVSGIIGDGATRAFELLGRLSIWEPLSIFYVLAAVLTLVITGGAGGHGCDHLCRTLYRGAGGHDCSGLRRVGDRKRLCDYLRQDNHWQGPQPDDPADHLYPCDHRCSGNQ